ncbi:MAG: UvrD-helicase domain-containing protein [Coriobacteriales bacterium]|jgi:superfamily I DNA/RNA helicase|nr:UvrD-helicase domain-containing protein [Coriobacteriales bacterium]
MLSDEVRRAAASKARRLRVLGGVGSGKTTAIARRVAGLLDAGEDGQGICVVAAGRSQAQKLREALTEALTETGVVLGNGVRVLTIRALCREALSTQKARAATAREPRLLNGIEELFLLEDLKAAGFEPKRLREGLEALYRSWADLSPKQPEPELDASLSALLISRHAMLPQELAYVAWHYLKGAEDAQAVTSADVPAATWTDAQAATSVTKPYKHLLVDDYQDLSRAAQAVTELLCSHSLAIAGNPHQSSSALETHPYPLGMFEPRWESVTDVETVVLAKTARCPQRIAAGVNALALSIVEQEKLLNVPGESSSSDASVEAPASARGGRLSADVMGSARESACDLLLDFDAATPLGQVHAVKWVDSTQECKEILSWLRRRFNDETDSLEPGQVLIVAPNRVWARQFARRCEALKQSYEAIISVNSMRGNPLRLDASAGMRSYTLLTLAAHPDDSAAWRSWCGFGEAAGNSVARQRAQGILSRCAGAQGERLLALLSDGDDASRDDFEQLLRPLAGDEDACTLYERASSQLLDPVFCREHRLRIATPQTVGGLEAKLVVIVGMVDGLLPTTPLRPGQADSRKAAEQRQRQRRMLYNLMGKASEELVFSFFQKAEPQTAERLGLAVRRLRPSQGGSSAMIASNGYLEEMGQAVPGIVSWLP